MGIKLINNTFALLHEAITETTDVLWLEAGHGAQFGSLAPGEYFYLTFPLLENGREVDWEVMKVTAIDNDFLTVERGQDGTVARSWPIGSRCEARVNKAVFRDLEAESDARIAVKADTTYVDAELAKKSDTTYVDAELAKKSDITYVDAELAKKSDITYVDAELAKKVDITSIIDDLTSTLANQPLSANQGRVLKELIDNINTILQSDDTNLDELQEIVDFIKMNREDLDSLSIPSIAGLEAALNSKVDKVTGKQLSTEDYTTDEKNKLAGIQAGATANATDAQLRDRSTHTGTQPHTTVTGLGTAATADVTTSATDTTAGRLLKVGDFGLGSPVSSSDDLNNNRTSGIYAVGGGTLNAPAVGVLEVYVRSSSRILQRLTALGGANNLADGTLMYQRAWVGDVNGGTWTPWRIVYTSGSIVGTVSQSGGVPTGAIIQRGSNANGEFVRYADGTQICTRQITTLQWSTSGVIVSFPASFVGSTVHGGIFVSDAQDSVRNLIRDAQFLTYVVDTGWVYTSRTGSTEITVNRTTAIAIGRWW